MKKYESEKGFKDEEVKPQQECRPLGLSYSPTGTYSEDMFIDVEQLTKNKIYIYTKKKNTSFECRFLMKRVEERWKIDTLQERLDDWQRSGL